MKFPMWTPALAGLLLVAGVQTLEASPAGDSVQDIRASYKAAKSAKTLTVDESLGWIEQLYGLAAENAGGDEGYTALTAILEIQGAQESKDLESAAARAPGMIISGYSNELGKMEDFINRTAPDEEQIELLRTTTTNDSVVATCFLADLQSAMEGAGYGKISEDKVIRGMGACEELTGSKYGDLKSSRGKAFRDLVEGDYFQLQNLRIGMIAPDIVAKDFDGVEFKLSDYRGKVLVLDFWGNW